jgi:hypothetical protein
VCAGVILGDYLLAEHRHRYNIRAARRHLGMPDFGHYDLDLFDACYSLWEEVYGDPLCQNWTPLSQFAQSKSVYGIGPLVHDVQLVPNDLDMEKVKMSKAVKFLAQRMGVVFPPLPLCTPAEFALFNKLCRTCEGEESLDFVSMQKDWVKHLRTRGLPHNLSKTADAPIQLLHQVDKNRKQETYDGV